MELKLIPSYNKLNFINGIQQKQKKMEILYF